MRLIVSCTECKRQYDATGRAVGSRFRCTCGSVVDIREPKGHSAAVVRCSSCGAGRQDDAASCGHCGADFTLHERDLHTICPGCLSRISDAAKFCHSCGIPMAVDGEAGTETELRCPVCGDEHRLNSRALAQGLSVLECGRCAGMWLGNDMFEHVVSRAEEVSITIHGHGHGPDRGTTSPVDRQTGPAYRPCIRCGALMNRKNYGKRSNVIIDVCKEHGVWFDSDELSRILVWIRDGGLESMRMAEKEKLRIDQKLAAMTTQPTVMMHSMNGDDGPDLVSGLIRLFW